MLLHQWPMRVAASLGHCSLRSSGSFSPQCFSTGQDEGVLTQSCNRTQRVGQTLTNRDHSVVVLAPYGLTATTASSSVVGLCRDVTVTHSPGFTVLIAANPLSGTLMRIVRY